LIEGWLSHAGNLPRTWYKTGKVLSVEVIRRLRLFRGAEFGRGTTPQEIELAEERRSVELPESHKEFLERFGWASLGRQPP